MSAPQSKTGIDTRHRKVCATREGRGCDCKPTYQAHVYDAATGRRIRKSFPTRTAAKLWRQDALVALRHGEAERLLPPRGRTVGEGLDGLLAGMRDGTALDRSGRRYRPSTIRGYESSVERHLRDALGHLRLAEVRRGDVQALVDRLHAQGFTGSTVRNKLDPLRVLYRRAEQDEEVHRNPTERLRMPALRHGARQVAEPERAERLLDALPPSERPLWATMFYAGLRVGEARALRWRHVDFDGGRIVVEASWDDHEGEQDTKTAAGRRTVPLVGRLRTELAAHKLATGRGPDGLCFGRTAVAPEERTTIRSRANRAWQGTGLAGLTPHEARHTCASYLAAAGLTPKEMQTAMGHADIRTTLNIYAKAVPGWEEGAAAKLDAYLDAPPARQSRDS